MLEFLYAVQLDSQNLQVFAVKKRIRNRKSITSTRNMTAPSRIPAFVIGLSSLFLLSACAEQPLEKVSVVSEENCQKLHKIIAEYPSGFTSFRRGAPSITAWQNTNVWNAESLYPKTTCQIWDWGKGLSNYSCQWKETDKEAAEAAYHRYTPEIQSCLGSEWSVSEPQAKTGKETVFRSPSTNAVISIRYFQDTRPPFSKPWYTSMVIGDLVETIRE